MRSTSLLAFVGALLAASVSMTATSSAQTATGQLTGTVRDATGAVMAGVKVVVTNEQTGLTRQSTTGGNGEYVIPLLPVGVYVVTGEQAGFKTAIHSSVALTVDQIQRVDMVLAPGNVSESVEVQADALVLDSGSASVGHTITERQVTELPLNGRNFLQLLFLGAGAVETTGEQGGMRQGVGNAISIMGGRPTSNNFMIDGTANIDTSIGTPAAVLVGRRDPGVQGTDDDVLRRVWVQLEPDQPGQQNRHERLPRDRLRILPERRVGREKLLRRQVGAGAAAGPEAVRVRRRRAGDAARVRRPEPDILPRQLRGDPDRPGRDELRHGADAAGADRSVRLQRSSIRRAGTPFPNNAVPQARFSQLAQLAIRNGWFPTPNSSAAQGNYQSVRTFPQVQDQFTIRGDQDLARFGRVFVRYTNTSYENTTSSNLIEAGRPGVRAGHPELAGLAQLAHSEHRRQPVPARPCRCARRPARRRVRAE